MDFYDYATTHDLSRRAGLTNDAPAAFYRQLQAAAYVERARGVQGMAVEFNRYASELNWFSAGRPYYKLWPAIIPLLAGVGIDVPVDYLRLPFSAFLVRFPMHDNPLRVDDEHAVRSILVNDGENDAGERRMFLWIDVGELHHGCWPVLTFCQLDCVPGIAIEEAFNRLPRLPVSGLHVPRELQEDCLRVVVSVCFLATGADRLIEPEVLSKDLVRYLDALKRDRAVAERLVEKAKRRGKVGWHVGQHERVLHLSRAETHGEGNRTAHGPLRYRHQRRAHFRLLPAGRVTFVRQATVRPDLPPPERAAAYRVEA